MIQATELRKAPQKAGVYFFKKGNTILYIGKAANLRARLSSYARLADLDGAKRAMVKAAASLLWEETANDIEALIREAMLIKRHRPQYNIMLRDDKNYVFVGFTKEKYPRIFTTHQPFAGAQNQKSKIKNQIDYIGPFTSGLALKTTLRLLRKIFPYCTCKRPHKRACQYAQLGLCLGFCCSKLSKSFLQTTDVKSDVLAYRKNIRAIKDVLRGKRISVAHALKKELAQHAKKREYEKAAAVRDQLAALERIFAHRPFLRNDIEMEHEKGLRLLTTVAKLSSLPRRIEAYDISHHKGKESVGSMVVFEDGVPAKSQYRKFKIRQVTGINDPAMIQEILMRRVRHTEWPMPDFMLIDGGKPQLHAALASLRSINSPFSHGKNKSYTYVTIAALAKREEELYFSNKPPIALKTMPPPLLHLLQHLRNEAHRFAITFSRSRFRKRQIK
jgi:excinuclease ABC subunit C